MSMPWRTSTVLSSGPTLIVTIGVANFLLNLELAGQLQSRKDAQETHSIFVARGRIGGKPKTGRKIGKGATVGANLLLFQTLNVLQGLPRKLLATSVSTFSKFLEMKTGINWGLRRRCTEVVKKNRAWFTRGSACMKRQIRQSRGK
jgi:hypothetical protein